MQEEARRLTRERIKLQLMTHLLDLANAGVDRNYREIERVMERIVDEFERVAGSPAH